MIDIEDVVRRLTDLCLCNHPTPSLYSIRNDVYFLLQEYKETQTRLKAIEREVKAHNHD